MTVKDKFVQNNVKIQNALASLSGQDSSRKAKLP